MWQEILNRFNTLEKAFRWHVVGLQSSGDSPESPTCKQEKAKFEEMVRQAQQGRPDNALCSHSCSYLAVSGAQPEKNHDSDRPAERVSPAGTGATWSHARVLRQSTESC